MIKKISKISLTDEKKGSFSHGNICVESARINLEKKYKNIIKNTDLFSRRTVSFQASKVESLHGWMKYREGFSADLVTNLFKEIGIKKGDNIIDPFAGSCTTLLEAQFEGINSTGIEILPNCQLAWDVKSNVFKYDLDELYRILKKIKSLKEPSSGKESFRHLKITESAFPSKTEDEIVGYAEWIKKQKISDVSKKLLNLILMDSLEDLSYTRKDGQYLRWDMRSKKIIERNKKRIVEGKSIVNGIDKGVLPTTKATLIDRLSKVIRDIETLKQDKIPSPSKHILLKGNALFEFSGLKDESFDGLITSPPYLNRYDYTRTYALELAYLDVAEDIFSLRQDLLSATVENKSKQKKLFEHYKSLGNEKFYNNVIDKINNNKALNEVAVALVKRASRGEVNNDGIIGMVAQYFEELTFLFAEIYRVMKKDGHVVFVNDNVRYAGEVIPVDTIMTSLAESLGFKAVSILVIPQRKGNSSQQMKKYGRRALRKSLTIWKK